MKIYCMSDIHGCLAEFEEALSRIEDRLESEDTRLVLLGDYIHGRQDGRYVLDKIMELQYKYGRDKVVALMGNHEEFVLLGYSTIAEMNPTYSEEQEIEWDDKTEMNGTEKYIEQHTKFPFMAHDDMVDSTSQALARLIKFVTGEEPTPERNYIRFTKWYPDMWEDYDQMNSYEQEQFIKIYGAPLEWAPDDYVDPMQGRT